MALVKSISFVYVTLFLFQGFRVLLMHVALCISPYSRIYMVYNTEYNTQWGSL